MSNCTVRVNRNTKVLEIVKSGGREGTRTSDLHDVNVAL